MCNACGFPTAPGHWTDAGADTPGDRLRMQYRRAQVLKKILASYGLSASIDGQIPGIQLSSFTGGRKTCVISKLSGSRPSARSASRWIRWIRASLSIDSEQAA